MSSARGTPAQGPWQLHPQLAEDTHPVAHLPLSELRLMDDSNHPWLVLVPRVLEATELVDLDPTQQAALWAEVNLASHALRRQFRPDKLNVAALGNMVPQLHVHVIARFTGDIAWPRPVWGTATARPYPPEVLVQRVAGLQAALEQ